MCRRIALSFLAAIPLAIMAAQAGAAELKVLGAGPVDGTFKRLIPAFMNATGHKVEGTFDTVGVIQDKLKKGEKADVIILSTAVMEDMEKAGSLLAGTRVEIGRGTSGFAVRAGAPVPDVSTPDAMKATLLAARSVAYVDPALGATTGIHFAKVLERLAIADAVNKKAVLFRRGYELADAVADGRAEIGNTNLTELVPHKGLTVVGPMPDPLALVVVYVAGVSSTSPNADGARALVAFLTSPEARASFKAAGL
jgi:molybdate transport system substrate-binding protein